MFGCESGGMLVNAFYHIHGCLSSFPLFSDWLFVLYPSSHGICVGRKLINQSTEVKIVSICRSPCDLCWRIGNGLYVCLFGWTCTFLVVNCYRCLKVTAWHQSRFIEISLSHNPFAAFCLQSVSFKEFHNGYIYHKIKLHFVF